MNSLRKTGTVEKSDSYRQSVNEPSQPIPEPPIEEEKGLNVERWQLERHVLQTLQAAKRLSNHEPINAKTILIAALSIERQSKSPAFEKLKDLIPLSPTSTSKKAQYDSSFVFDLTEPLSKTISYARDSLDPDIPLWGRDLIASVFLAQDDPSLNVLAEEVGTTIHDLQDHWYLFVMESEKHRTKEEWKAWWKWAHVPTPENRNTRAGISNDTTGNEDHLDIQDDVDALALLITDTKTKPPLSIGLLGDWGSGKSYFMDLMQKKVDELEGKVGLCKKVVQIRFNAWHYSDTNIWASLVGYLFEEIWREMVPENTPAKERKKLEDEIKAANGALFEVQAELEDAIATLETAEQDREIALNTLAIQGKVRDTSIRTINRLSSIIGWEEPLDAIVQLEKAHRSLTDSTVRTEKMLDVALGSPGIRRALLWMILTVLIAAGVTFAAELYFQDDDILTQQALQTLATIGGIITSVAGAAVSALGRGNSAVKRFNRQLEGAIKEYNDYLKEAGSTETIIQRDQEIREARADVERLEATIQAARQRIETLEFRQLSLDPAQRLRSFLQERATTDDYRAREGIISLVRRDFERMAELMEDYRTNGDQVEAKTTDHIIGIDRVVLYIDDLDRCASDIVVRTLEIVHLLLALDLFMVVVAVDSRWLIRALEVHYQDMLGIRNGEGDTEVSNDRGYRLSTPQNYLEKIFQITFALAPMSPSGYGTYVDFLTEDEHKEEEEGEPPLPSINPSQDIIPSPLLSDSNGAPNNNQQGSSRPLVPSPSPTYGELDPARSLTISETERLFLKSLSAFVTTPRLAKRMVNVFRLLKSRISLKELSSFRDETTGRYRPMLLLLALLYGRPELATVLFRSLCEGTLRPENSAAENLPFHKAIHTLASASNEQTSHDNPWIYLAKQVERVAPDITLKECEEESIQIARYSIVTGQFWHTWHRLNA